MPYHCEGCSVSFSICHALDCKKGGLVTARHNDLCDWVSNFAEKAFTPADMPDDPKIFTGRAVQGGRKNSKQHGRASRHCRRRRGRIRETCRSGVFGLRVWTTFTTYVL